MALPATALGSLVERHRKEILATARSHKGHKVAVFGSVARGEDGQASDIDLLVEFDDGSSLLDVIELEDALRALLGVGVDVVSAGALLDRDDDIRSQAVPL